MSAEVECTHIIGSHGLIHIVGQLSFDTPQNIGLGPINDIGIPGNQGFGVGVCPTTFEGYSTMEGTFDPASANYGNYRYSDGSIMVWIPAFFYKWGTGANGVALNRVGIKNYYAFLSVTAANSAGYALHRAFYDGGQIKAGVFRDKFMCSNNGGIASSIHLGNPLSTSASHNPLSGLTGAPSNTYGGTFAAAKTRGTHFFPASGFIDNALAMLSKAHADASTSTAFCAWYNPAANFPKGNNNNALGDTNDGLLSFVSDGYVSGNSAKSGSGSVMAKTTHNGQSCGVTDVNGNMYKVSAGLTSDGTNFYILKTSVAMKSLTGGNTLSTDAFGASGIAANYDSLGATFLSLYAGGVDRTVRYGNGAEQVFDLATSGNTWAATCFGIAKVNGVSAGGTTEFGNDYFVDRRANECFPISGGIWSVGSGAGVWARDLNTYRVNSGATVGFCAASYGS